MEEIDKAGLRAENLRRNLAALVLGDHTRRAIADAEPAGEYVVHDGEPILMWQGSPLEGPLPDDVRDVVRKALDERPGPILIFGFGALHFATLARELAPGRRILLYEPHPGILRNGLEVAEIQQGGVEIVCDPLDARTAICNSESDEATTCASIANPLYQRAFPREWEDCSKAIVEALNSNQLNVNAFGGKCRPWIENSVRNLARSHGAAPILSVPPLHVPAFVVGAGPSLDKNGHLLEQAKRKGLVIAVDGALEPLLRMGVAPHAVAMIESKDKSAQLARIGDIPRLYGLAAHPSAYSRGNGRLMPFVFANYANVQLAALLGSQLLAAGSNVTNAAMAIAFMAKCKPVVFVGNDLAFTGGSTYASGHQGGGAPLKDPTVRTCTAWGGDGEVQTRIEMNHSRWWLETVVRHLPDLELINATEGGARIEGVREARLADLLDELPDVDVPDLRTIDVAPVDGAAVRAWLRMEADRANDLEMLAARLAKQLRRAAKAPSVSTIDKAKAYQAELARINLGASTWHGWARSEIEALRRSAERDSSPTPAVFRADSRLFAALSRAASAYRGMLRSVEKEMDDHG